MTCLFSNLKLSDLSDSKKNPEEPADFYASVTARGIMFLLLSLCLSHVCPILMNMISQEH